MKTFLPTEKDISSLSATETLGIFRDAFHAFLAREISVDEFSHVSYKLWLLAEKHTGGQNDLLWSELADPLSNASELSWYARKGVENYPMFFNDVEFFLASHKKIGKNQRKTTT